MSNTNRFINRALNWLFIIVLVLVLVLSCEYQGSGVMGLYDSATALYRGE